MKPNLRDYRKRKGMNQEALGKLLGLAKSTVSMIEREERELPVHSLTLFEKLVEGELGQSVPTLQAHPPFSVEEVKERSIQLSVSTLQRQLQDREADLVMAKRKLRKWKDDFTTTLANYGIAHRSILQLEAQGRAEQLAPQLNQKNVERVKTLQKLLKIGGQVPALTTAKIAGLEAEIKALKKLLKKPRYGGGDGYLGLPF